MLKKGKVSIVVPLYKVEKYIHRCIDSIRNQTYADLEIILINDGSPDHCGHIADDYKKKDDRIRVFHKENGGLSDARNYGMKQVGGEYTMFVDSDDWINSDMIETLVKSCMDYEADVVQGAFYYAYDDKLLVDCRYFRQDEEPVVLTKKEAMHELVKNEKIKNFAWGKLYKTALIRHIPFEKGVLFEDVFWAHQVIHQVKRYLILHQPFYYYYQRNDSIVATYTPRNLDVIKGLKERLLFMERFYPELVDESWKQILKTSFIHYHLLIRNRKQDPANVHKKKIKTDIRKNGELLKKVVKNDKELSRQLHLFLLHPYLNIGFLVMRKGLRSMKILTKPAGLQTVNQKQRRRLS